MKDSWEPDLSEMWLILDLGMLYYDHRCYVVEFQHLIASHPRCHDTLSGCVNCKCPCQFICFGCVVCCVFVLY